MISKKKELGIKMYYYVAEKISNISIEKGWIEESQKEWCIYAFQRRIESVFWIAIIILIANLTGKLRETFLCSAIIFLLRRRIGGWHASNPRVCQTISISILLLIVMCWGPALEKLSNNILLLLGIMMGLIMMGIKPVYPQQLHFDEEVMRKNHKIKNLLSTLMIVIVVVLRLFMSHMIAYIVLGIATVLGSVLMEVICAFRRGDFK